tara:strand:- start:2645 stop:3304 length:660 start_codon:yes stop_codon:yes gene_type:complete
MCNPMFAMAGVSYMAETMATESHNKAMRQQARNVARLKASQAHGEGIKKATAVSVERSNTMRKVSSAQGLAEVKMAARGISGGTAYSSKIQEFGQRSNELEGALNVKARQVYGQYQRGVSNIQIERDMAIKQYGQASLGDVVEGFGMAMLTSAATQYALGVGAFAKAVPDLGATATAAQGLSGGLPAATSLPGLAETSISLMTDTAMNPFNFANLAVPI